MKKFKMILIAICVVCGMFFQMKIFGVAKTERTEPDLESYSVQIGITIYYGEYTGKLKNGIPNGKGTFEGESLDNERIKYTGKWQDGEIEGRGTLYYDDGIYMKGTFADNLASGKMKIFKKDGSYKSVIYNKGIPAGFVEYYDADGKWIKQDFYYRNALLSDLIKSSLVPDYSKLFSEEDSYKGKLIKITGIVEMMEESDQSCYFKIKDQKGNKYICQYNNLTFNLEAQTLIPNIDTGDQVTIYGYFQSITRNIIESDKEDYGFSFPEIDPFYGVKDEKKEILRNELKFTYKDIYENAYYYFKVNHTWEGKVSNLIYQDKYFIMELELPSQDKIMIYVKKDKWNTIPVPGDTVKLEGYVRGYYKRIFGDGFIKKYPYIQLTKRITKESKDD